MSLKRLLMQIQTRRSLGAGLLRVVQGLLLITLLASTVTPALAGEKMLFGSPDLSAAISGTNQFSPGATIQLPIVIQNTGLNELKIVESTIINRDDLPNTAKLVTVRLSSGDAPVTVKTDPQMIGDILGGATKPVVFTVDVKKDAVAGTYTIPLQIDYTYLADAEQYGTDSIRYNYVKKSITIPMKITIESDVRLEVTDFSAEQVNVGTEGYLTLSLKNVGHDYARNAVAKIARNDASPIIPTDSSVYIGDFRPNDTITCRYKVSISGNAEAQSYPLDVYVEYEKSDGSIARSDRVTLGIPVGGKIDFAVRSVAADLHPGGKQVIEVVYENIGATTAYNAQARLSAVDPFTSNDDTAFLGNLAPGETAAARFELGVDGSATPKEYGIDSEIRYRDALDNSQISDTMKVQVGVTETEGLLGQLQNPILLSLIAAGCICSGYYVLRLRKKE
jgi:hypothetical protein